MIKTHIKEFIFFADKIIFNPNAEKVPLDKILFVEIEIFSYCNRQCWFCPNSFIDRHSKNIFMDEKLYLQILEDLKSINYRGMIAYSRYNEPLSHKDIFIKRLKQAKESVPNALLHTHTNGDYLTKEYLDELYEAGLRSMDIQCYLNEKEAFDIEKIKGNIAKTAAKLNLDYKVTHISQDVYHVSFDYKDMRLLMYALDFNFIGNNRGGTLKTITPQERKAPCYVPFSDIYIDYTGYVMPCCNFRSDVQEHKKFILGNANKTSILKIFNNKKATKLRAVLRNSNIKLYPCNECNFAKYKERVMPPVPSGPLVHWTRLAYQSIRQIKRFLFFF